MIEPHSLTQVTDAAGAVTRNAYNSLDLPTSTTDPRGGATSFEEAADAAESLGATVLQDPVDGPGGKRRPGHGAKQAGQGQTLPGPVRDAVLRSESAHSLRAGEVLVMMQHPRCRGLYEQAAWSPLGPFAVEAAFPPSDYYGPSAPGRPDACRSRVKHRHPGSTLNAPASHRGSGCSYHA
ncbi:MAG: RHS repeat protein [Chloroflexi bacterium]|nr:RHS repeat protein [Chloroflexota bacterium]